MFFVQMSGFPGSGKSTLALEIARRTGAMLIDHDIIKTALLQTINGVSTYSKQAGKISYAIDWFLIEFHLTQGRSVVFDSPCLYQEVVEKGTNLSKKYNVSYKYVECYLNDIDEINARLENRERLISQIKKVESKESFNYALENSKKPLDVKCLMVETDVPLDTYINEVMSYINE